MRVNHNTNSLSQSKESRHLFNINNFNAAKSINMSVQSSIVSLFLMALVVLLSALSSLVDQVSAGPVNDLTGGMLGALPVVGDMVGDMI